MAQVLLCQEAHGLSFDGTSIHGYISQVSQQLLGAVLSLNELEKLWRVIYELEWSSDVTPIGFQEDIAHCCPGLSSNENVVSEKAEQEGNVGLWMCE